MAENVTRHGTGGLNIDSCRIGSTEDDRRKTNRPCSVGSTYSINVTAANFGVPGVPMIPENGRWPANVILEHRPECRQVGTKKVKGGNDPRRGDGSKSGHNFHGFNLKKKHDRRPCDHEGFSDKDGLEEIPAWECEPDCPVKALDEQSGNRPSTWTNTISQNPSTAKPVSKFRPNQDSYMPQGQLYADGGGASRFFKQVKGR